MAKIKRCGTCKWSKWKLTKNGSGICAYEVVLPVLPWCCRQLNVEKMAIWAKDGEGCQCYEDIANKNVHQRGYITVDLRPRTEEW